MKQLLTLRGLALLSNIAQSEGARSFWSTPTSFAGAMSAHALMSGRGDVDKRLLDQMRAAGIEHYVWTINDPKLGPTYKAQGVDAIITDRPAEMRAALNSSANP